MRPLLPPQKTHPGCVACTTLGSRNSSEVRSNKLITVVPTSPVTADDDEARAAAAEHRLKGVTSTGGGGDDVGLPPPGLAVGLSRDDMDTKTPVIGMRWMGFPSPRTVSVR